jgi:hypothetical protein
MEVKVKVKIKIKFNLEQATKSQRRCSGTGFFFNLGAE